MPLAKNREQITVSGEAHAHLKALVVATKRKGLPTSGTALASAAILAIPIPEAPATEQPKRRARKAHQPAPAAQATA